MIVVCPRCNRENRIADHPNPKVKYRCGKCRFPFSQLPAMTCPQCGVPAASGNVFCTSCGTELLRGSAKCPGCGFTVRPDAKLCGQCGRSLQFKEYTIKGLSKPFYLGIFIGGSILTAWWSSWWWIYFMRMKSDPEYVLRLVDHYSEFNIIGGAFNIVSLLMTIVALVFWYRAWASIQDGFARTTPGKAIGFLFIPIYQLYWEFQVVWGFAKDYNAYVARHQISSWRINQKLFLAMPALPLLIWPVSLGTFIWMLRTESIEYLTLIPMAIPWTINSIVIALVINRTCDAVNTLAEHYRVRSAQDSETQPTV